MMVRYASGHQFGHHCMSTYRVEVERLTDDDSIRLSFVGPKPEPEAYHHGREDGQLSLPAEVAAKTAMAILAATTGPPGDCISFDYDERKP